MVNPSSMLTDRFVEPIRWLHLSDFHIGMDDYFQRKLFDEILKHVEQRISEGFGLDLVFITGDIADKGKSDQYDTFVSEFLSPLHKLMGADAHKKIFIVPGNHDVIVDAYKYFSRDEIYGKGSHFFDPTCDGLKERCQVLPRFETYAQQSLLTPTSWLDTDLGAYVAIIEIRSVKLGIVGINTAWVSKGTKKGELGDRHCLSPGIHILEDSLKKLGGCNIKIVIGHHPIDWFHDLHVNDIKVILGEHQALYLHGHLHRVRVTPEADGQRFLCVQSGAAFQSRPEDETEWVNGILWAELDVQLAALRLQPREWREREWRVSRDLPNNRQLPDQNWWQFPLPCGADNTTSVAAVPLLELVRYPIGWQPIDAAFLDRQRELIDNTHASRFFDGAVPDWRIVLSKYIPHLDVVTRAFGRLMNYSRVDRPQVVLLIGPSGEGKSTALMQAIVNLLETDNSWNILWHTDESAKLDADDVLALPQTGIPWLLVSDAADMLSRDLHDVCQRLSKARRADVRFLLASRDTDWKAAKAHEKDWISYTDLQQEIVSGLKKDDARAIVRAWISFEGDAARGIAGQDQDAAAQQLLNAARIDAPRKEGSLLGATLKVRYGDDLTEHVKALLNRLAERKIPGGGDLMRAFSYTAAMHAEGLNFLSRPVLSEVLGCPLNKLNPLVLTPLGMEAATSSDGQFVLTRHGEIARAAINLLQDVFYVSVEDLYLDLLMAAEELRGKREFVPLLGRWYFDVPDHFFKKGRKDLSIRMGEALLQKNPDYVPLRVHLSRLYREAGDHWRACGLFRSTDAINRGNRFTLMEWGKSEQSAGNPALGAALMALSLNDDTSTLPVDIKGAGIALGGLAGAFGSLYDLYLEPLFKLAFLAVARMGLMLAQNEESRKHFVKELETFDVQLNDMMGGDADLSTFREAVLKAMEYLKVASIDSATTTLQSTTWCFESFRRLLVNAAHTKRVDKE